MGANRDTSVVNIVNTYLQHWDADNLFVVGAGNFIYESGYNPTGTVGALEVIIALHSFRALMYCSCT